MSGGPIGLGAPSHGAGGSGPLRVQRRRRKARSLRVGLPNRAVPMTMSAAASSTTAMSSPSMMWSAPMATGPPSVATLAPIDRQGSRSRVTYAALSTLELCSSPLMGEGAALRDERGDTAGSVGSGEAGALV
jgi:hypothetical protein